MAMHFGFGDRMQVDEPASDQSSSSLSPPPTTPQHTDTINVARPPFLHPRVSGEGVANSTSATSANAAARAQNGNTSAIASTANGSAPEKPKRQRNKKEVGPDGKPVDDGKPKRTRKPKEPKEKTAGSTATVPRKKQKIEEKITHDAPVSSRQPTLTEIVNGFQQPVHHTTSAVPPQPQHRPSLGLPTSNPPTPRPVSSGQNYDPVRGYDPVRAVTLETAQQRPTNITNATPSAQASPHVNRASASPSIASLIDPPMTSTKTSMPAPSHYSPQTVVQHAAFVPSQPRSPTPPKPAPPAYPHPPPPQSPPPAVAKPAAIPSIDGAMDIDLTCDAPKPPPEIKAASKSSSSGPTPKPARPTPPPAPKGTGSGLLSSSDLFGAPSSSEGPERRGVNIDIHIPLNPQGGNTVNIAHEIAKKYGRDAINPRAAAHREELLRIAAAAHKIDGNSADDMSADLLSDMGDDSNVEMGGMDDEKSGTGANGKAPVRRRRKKVEEYDKEDDFIDDTELAWQEQAAVAKDGFFVYSGPLIPPGKTANVESTAPSGRGGRGRGRGGGRGSHGGAGANGTTHASLAEKSKDVNAPARGRARRRGTGAPRKPRITKADRERMEAEKADRERAGQQQLGGPTGAPLAMAPMAQQQQAVNYGGPPGTVA